MRGRIFKAALGLLACLALAQAAAAGETGHVSAVDNAKRGADAGIRMEGYRGTASAVGEYGVGSAVGGLFTGQVLGNSFCSIEAYGARMHGFISSGNGGELCPLLLGGDAHARHTGTGDVPYLAGLRVKVELGGAGSTTDEMGGVDVEAANAGGTAALAYGLRLPDMTSLGTDSWAIMSLGGDSFHVGRLTLGSTDPPATDAILDLDTTDHGALLPRLTTAQRDALTPSLSMVVFNTTTAQFEFWTGAVWSPMGVSDHGALTGLADDDHTQYHNDSRAMTWLLANDGTGSTIDADLLDGVSSAAFGLVANPLSQFAATTSAQLAGVLSDETGFSTGALSVFNINPTLVGVTLTGSGAGNAKLGEWGGGAGSYALGLGGDLSTGNYSIRQAPGSDLRFNVPTGQDFYWHINNSAIFALTSTYFGPGNAGGLNLGRAGVGVGSIFVDSASTANTLELTRPTIASNIQVAWPASAGTLALTSDIHAPITLSGAYDYITLSGQDIVRGQIDLTTDVTGTLPSGNGGMVYPGAGIPLSTGGAWGTSITDSAGLRGAISDESGNGALLFANGNIGEATGTSVALTGSAAVGGFGSFLSFGGLSSGWRIGAGFGSLSFGSWIGGDTMAFTGSSLRPVSAGGIAIGSAALGVSSVFLDEAGAGTQTAQIVAPTLASDVVLTTPEATGTLATVATTAIIALDGNQNGNYNTTPMNIFPAAGDSLSAIAGFYYFDGVIQIQKTNGTNLHHVIFSMGGTATVSYLAFGYHGSQGAAAAAHTNQESGLLQTASGAGGRVTPSSTTGSEYFHIQVHGWLIVSAAGTLIPQAAWNAAPGDGSTTGRMVSVVGSSFRMFNAGTGNKYGGFN